MKLNDLAVKNLAVETCQRTFFDDILKGFESTARRPNVEIPTTAPPPENGACCRVTRIGVIQAIRDLYRRSGRQACGGRSALSRYIILARKLNRMTSVPETIRITISVENRIS